MTKQKVKEIINNQDKMIINLSLMLSDGEKGLFFKNKIGCKKKEIGEQFTRLTTYDRSIIHAEIRRLQAKNKALEGCFEINEPRTFNSSL